MAQVVYSPTALDDLERLLRFLLDHDPRATVGAAASIREAVNILKNHPLVGRRVTGDLRELVISYGRTGCVALYRYRPAIDTVRILAIRHQGELDYPV